MTPQIPADEVGHQRTRETPVPTTNPWTRTLLNKVPEVTILFWVVKILSTTVGETAADYLNDNLGLGLPLTTALMSVLFVAVLVGQFATTRYVPGVYWLSVVLVSVVGTLFSDNVVENLGVSLFTSTGLFAVCLALVFAGWYRPERTLSIHTTVTRKREAFYWATILFTFALGTSAGDLISEKLALGYVAAALIFGGVIVVISVAYFGFKINAVLAFWAAYVMTRPFGASIGDLLTAPTKDGGLDLGTTGTSALFLVVIVPSWPGSPSATAVVTTTSGASADPGAPPRSWPVVSAGSGGGGHAGPRRLLVVPPSVSARSLRLPFAARAGTRRATAGRRDTG